MQKFLRTLMLMALMIVPFASNAQTMYLTVADSTATNSYVPVHGNYMDDPLGCQSIYPAEMLTDMIGENILSLHYYVSSGSSTNWGSNKPMLVKLMVVTESDLSAGYIDVTDATTVYDGTISSGDASVADGFTVDFTTPFMYTGGNLLVSFQINPEDVGGFTNIYWYGKNLTGASRSGYGSGNYDFTATGTVRNFLPKTTFMYGTAPSCFKVQNLTASAITSSSITLSWNDTVNTGATYTIYDLSDTTAINVTIVNNTAVIDGLDANTLYSFGVETDCGAGDIANGYAVVSARTSCEVESLPFTESFDATLASDFCWRGASILYTDSVNVTMGNNSNWTYSNTVSNGLEAGHYRVNIYGTSCKSWMITPEIDFTTATSPLLSFDAAFTKYSGTAVAEGFESNETQMFLILVSTNNGETWSTAANISLSSIASTTYIPQYVDLSAYAGETVRIAFYAQSTTSGGDNNLHIDNISIDESTGEICYPPANVAVSGITTTAATLTWNGSASSYALTLIGGGDTVEYSYYDTVAEFYTLMANTQYTASIVSECGDEESAAVSITFRTSCGIEALPFTESFDATLASDPCWRGASILYTDSVNVTMGNNSNWTYFSTASNGLEAGHYRVNIYGTSCYKWMITPEIDFTTATSPLLSFDAAFTKYSGTAVAEGFESNETQMFLILVSTNNGETWSTAANISLSSIASTTYIPQYVDLSAYAGETVRIAFYAQSTTSGGDNNLHIDNISIDESTGEICYPVTGLTASDITSTGATLSWNGTEAGNYSVFDMSDPSIAMFTVSDTAVSPAALTPNTQYTFGVVANCTSSSSDTMTVTFNTQCAAVSIPFVESFDATSNTVACWTTQDVAANTGISDGAFRFAYSYNPPQYLISPELDGTEDGVEVRFLYKAYMSSYPESFVVGYSTTTNDTSAFTWGTEQTNLTNTDYIEYSEILPAGTKYVSIKYTAYDQYYLYIDSVAFNLAPACLPVTNLTVDSVTSTSVFLSWTGSAAAYNVYALNGAVLASEITTTSYEVTDLLPLTGYTFGVTAVCGTDESEITTVNALTACGGETCDITINSSDSYGDGWNGASIDVLQNGTVIASYSMEGQGVYSTPIYDTVTIEVCASTPVSFKWNSGAYDGEASFEILNGGNNTVYTCVDGSTMDDSVFFTLADACEPIEPDTVFTLTIGVNDTTLGTTAPVPGTYTYSGDDAIVLTAIPNTGANFLYWVMTYNGYVDTVTYQSVSFGQASNLMDNYYIHNMSMVAYFETITLPITCGGTSCYITIDGTDEYGDGWNEGSITLTQNDTVIGVMEMQDGSIASQTFMVCGDYPVNFTWNSGSYDDEVGFTIYGSDGSQLLYVNDGSMLTDSALFAIVSNVCGNATVWTSVQYDTTVFVVAVNDATMGTTNPVPGTYNVPTSDNFEITAIPNTGYYFHGWAYSYTYESVVYNDTVIDATMTYLSLSSSYWNVVTPVTFTALFYDEPIPTTYYTFNLTCDAAQGSVTGGGVYAENDTVVFSATPATGYHFLQWKLYAIDETGDTATWYTATANPLTFLASPNTFSADYTLFNCEALFELDPTPIACSSTSCFITINGADSFGDGWNGGKLFVQQNDTVVGMLVVNADSDSTTVEVCNDYPVELVWNSGSWDSEVSFNVISSTGAEILSVTSASDLRHGVFARINNTCTAPTVEYVLDTVSVTVAINNPTMGTTDPIPGTYTFVSGDTIMMTATPNTGYYFLGWNVVYTYEGSTYSFIEEDTTIGYFAASLVNYTPLTFTALFSDDSVMVTDTVHCTYAVNNAAWGTTNPAPGVYTYYNGDALSCVAIPNEGYHLVGWEVYVAQGATVVIDTVVDYPVEDAFDMFTGVAYVETGMNGISFGFTAIFAEGAAETPIDSLTVITSVNNADWGTITPAPGTHYYVEGQSFTINATANNGYYLYAYEVIFTYPGYGEIFNQTIPIETVDPDELASFLSYDVTEDMYGYIMSFKAIFQANEGIEDVESDSFTVSVNETTITVRGVEGQDVTLFDVNGRMLSREANAAESVKFRVTNSGVYLVKVNDSAAKRVVVIR